MISNIIEFQSAARKTRAPAELPAPTCPFPEAQPLPEKTESEIGRNERLRKERNAPWNRARARVQLLRAQADLHDAVAIAQNYNVPEARGFAKIDHHDRRAIIEAWRAAIVEQLLTPAPRKADLTWKRMTFDGFTSEYDFAGVKPSRIERSIADDDAFLQAHPTRHCRHRAATNI